MRGYRYRCLAATLCVLGILTAASARAGDNETSLLASTFLGGGLDSEKIYSMAVDSAGNVYVAGYTKSTDFPATAGAYCTSCSGYDAFIAKFDSDLKTLLAATLYGGEDGYEEARSIVIGPQGSIYIAGITGSDDLPTTPTAFQPEHRVGRVGTDAFVARFDAGLTTLQAATYLSGSDGGAEDEAYAVALSTAGSVYVTGWTDSPNFPVTAGSYDAEHGADPDAINPGGKIFIARLDADLTALQAGTFLGTIDGSESAYALAADDSQNVYVAGSTGADGFPVTGGAYDTTPNGGSDVFVARFNASLSSLSACTLLGGSESDTLGYDTPQQTDKSILLDADGNVYITGTTYSLDFPVTAGAFSTSREYAGTFVSKLDSGLTELRASTYLCNGVSRSIALDSEGNIYVAGDSEYGCPVPVDAYQTEEDQWGGLYIIRLDGALEKMLAATFFGGSERESALSIAVDAQDNLYVAGSTSSPDFPVTPEAYDSSFNSTADATDGFVIHFEKELAGEQSGPGGSDACPIETALADLQLLSTLRDIRDKALAKSAQQAVSGYYRHAPELSSILAARPGLSARLRRLMLNHRQQLASYAMHGRASVSAETCAEAAAFLRECTAAASPGLSRVLSRWAEQIADRAFLRSAGIIVQ